MTAPHSHPWGSLPLERYVLANWSSSTEPDLDERRRQLARQFTAIGGEGRAPYMLEAEGNVDLTDASSAEEILSPLRSDMQRYMATRSAFDADCFGILWLRTCYDADLEYGYQQLVGKLNDDLALDVVQNILDDKALYDYGDDWTRIFEVMPERLLELECPDPEYAERQQKHQERLQKLQDDYQNDVYDQVLVDLASEPRSLLDESRTTEAEIRMRIFRAKTQALHDEATFNYIFIADKVAIETGEVLIVFFDERGRTVRQSRMPADLCEGTAGAWANFAIYREPEFEDADVGQAYMI